MPDSCCWGLVDVAARQAGRMTSAAAEMVEGETWGEEELTVLSSSDALPLPSLVLPSETPGACRLSGVLSLLSFPPLASIKKNWSHFLFHSQDRLI